MVLLQQLDAHSSQSRGAEGNLVKCVSDGTGEARACLERSEFNSQNSHLTKYPDIRMLIRNPAWGSRVRRLPKAHSPVSLAYLAICLSRKV